MKKQKIKTLNPITWLVFGLGACSASSKVESLFSQFPQESYAFTCKSGDDTLGIAHNGGTGKIFKNGVLQFTEHRGSDLSLFFIIQYPSESLPLEAFSMEKEDPQALEYYNLGLEMDLATGLLVIEEEKYVRDVPGAGWTFDSRQEILKADNCVAN